MLSLLIIVNKNETTFSQGTWSISRTSYVMILWREQNILISSLNTWGGKLLSWLKEDEIGSTQQKISIHIHIAKDFSPNQQVIIF